MTNGRGLSSGTWSPTNGWTGVGALHEGAAGLHGTRCPIRLQSGTSLESILDALYARAAHDNRVTVPGLGTVEQPVTLEPIVDPAARRELMLQNLDTRPTILSEHLASRDLSADGADAAAAAAGRASVADVHRENARENERANRSQRTKRDSQEGREPAEAGSGAASKKPRRGGAASGFSAEEDADLAGLVRKHEVTVESLKRTRGPWDKIATELRTQRTSDQCRERFYKKSFQHKQMNNNYLQQFSALDEHNAN